MSKIFSALLRQPRNKEDRRLDPKYEEGSIGSTGCHSKNLLSEAGFRENRIQKGDRLIFIQGKRTVFITSPLRRINKNKDGYIVVYWNSSWKSKAKRPLKFKFAMKLDLNHLRMINPNIRETQKMGSHLRTYSQPLKNSRKFIQAYEQFIKDQKEEYGETIFIERYCQTFCERDECEECPRFAYSKSREKRNYSSCEGVTTNSPIT